MTTHRLTASTGPIPRRQAPTGLAARHASGSELTGRRPFRFQGIPRRLCHSALIGLAVLAVLAGTATAQQYQIDFDELAPGYVFDGTHQAYLDLGDGHGIRITSTSVPTVEAWSGARTLPNALVNEPPPGAEFGSSYLKLSIELIGFTSHWARLFVGLNQHELNPVTARMDAYRSDGGFHDWIGFDTVNLGNGPTDADHELRIETSIGDPNHGAIDYLEVTYGAAFAPEVIDNMVIRIFDGVVEPPPDDTVPPVVHVEDASPDNPVRTSVVYVSGTVEEDRGIDELWANGGAGLTAVTPIPIGPTSYLFSHPVSIPATEGDHTITVTAYDFGGNSDADSITVHYLPPDPPPPVLPDTLNFTASGMEVTQGIQGWEQLGVDPPGPSHRARLVRGKTTLARVYAAVSGSDGMNIPNVRCLLRAFRGATELPGSPLYCEETRTLIPGETLDTQRADASRTFNFVLPDEWTGAGSVQLRATVNPYNGIPEHPGSFDAYNDAVQDVYFYDTHYPLYMNVYRVQSINEGNRQPTFGQCLANLVTIQDIYPVPPDQFIITNCGGVSTETVLSTASDYQLYLFVNGFRHALGFHYLEPPRWATYSVYLALSHPDIHHRGMTLSSFPVSASVANTDEFYRIKTCHESGHALGLDHVQGCDDPADPFEPYPHYRQPDGTWLHNASIGDWALEWNADGTFNLLNPEDNRAMMSYCDDRWMSLYCWEWLIDRFGTVTTDAPPASPPLVTVGAAAPTAPAPYLIISGHVDPGHAGHLEPIWQKDFPAGSYDYPGTGILKLQLRKATGELLFERQFDPTPVIDLTGVWDFTEIVPAVPGVAKVELTGSLSAGAIITAGINPPGVVVTYPNGGESWPATGSTQITWSAGDTDGDPLTFTVWFSNDDGGSWQVLASDLHTAGMSVDLATLPGSVGKCWVRVQVSDGIHSASDTSNGPLSKAGQPPEVEIVAPHPVTLFTEGETAVLHAVVTDPDEPVLPNNIRWYSSQQGLLGYGARLGVTNLVPGMHRVMCKASDGDGYYAQAETAVYILPNTNRPLAMGDLNLDSYVNAADLAILINYVCYHIQPGGGEFRAPLMMADLNGNQVVNAQDLVVMANMLAGN
jgi:hypothetical protein